MPDFTPLGRPLPFRLILASGSRGRRELLELHRYTFDVIPSHIDEPTDARLGDCAHYVAELAWLKAQAVAKTQTSGVVLAADTVGWINNHVVGKPDDEAHARRILTELAGTTHELYTGVCLWHVPTGRQLSWQERSLVRMKALTPQELDTYLTTRLWVGCSGAYAITFPHDPYLTVEVGSTSNVIGLPMESLSVALDLMATW